MLNNPVIGWALAALAIAIGYVQWGWSGVVLAFTMIVFWLLLQFSRALRVLRNAGQAPMGQVPNAVMLHAKLQRGQRLPQILVLTKCLGSKIADDPETFEWRDARRRCGAHRAARRPARALGVAARRGHDGPRAGRHTVESAPLCTGASMQRALGSWELARFTARSTSAPATRRSRLPARRWRCELVVLEDGFTGMPTAVFYAVEGLAAHQQPQRLYGRAAIAAYVEGTEGPLDALDEEHPRLRAWSSAAPRSAAATRCVTST